MLDNTMMEADNGILIGIVTSVLTLFFAFGVLLLKIVMGRISENKISTGDAHGRIDKVIEDFSKKRDRDMKDIQKRLGDIEVAIARIPKPNQG